MRNGEKGDVSIEELEEVRESINNKVDKETGKGLSTNDFTNEDKEQVKIIKKLDSVLDRNTTEKAEILKIDDCKEYRADLKIYGNSKQISDNILNLLELQVTQNACCSVISKTENELTLLSNTEEKSSHIAFQIHLEAGTYYFQRKFQILGGTAVSTTGDIILYDSANNWYEIFKIQQNQEEVTFNVEQEGDYRLHFFIKTDKATNNSEIQVRFYDLMLNKKEIQTCKDNINVVVSNKNLINTNIIKAKNLPVFTNITSNSFTLDLSKGSVSSLTSVDVLFGKLDGTKQYTLSYHHKQDNLNFKPYLKFIYDDGSSGGNGNSSYENDIVSVSEANKKIVGIELGWNTQSNGGIVEFSNIQLEEGIIKTDYVEHKEQKVTMPLQTQLLEDDYLDFKTNEEVHIWKKITLDGVNYGANYVFNSGMFNVRNILNNKYVDDCEISQDWGKVYNNVICTDLNNVSHADLQQRNLAGISISPERKTFYETR